MKRLRSWQVLLAFVGSAVRSGSGSGSGGTRKVRGSIAGPRATPSVPDTGNPVFLWEKR
jgi:hypothetical protein